MDVNIVAIEEYEQLKDEIISLFSKERNSLNEEHAKLALAGKTVVCMDPGQVAFKLGKIQRDVIQTIRKYDS